MLNLIVLLETTLPQFKGTHVVRVNLYMKAVLM